MTGFVLAHLLALVLLGLSAWGAGTLVTRPLSRSGTAGLLPIRIAAGLAVSGAALFAAGSAGALRPAASLLLVALASCAGIAALRDLRSEAPASRGVVVAVALAAAPVFALALYPPIAFDETLYHLPTVERFAVTGGLPFIDHLRVPVFPHLDEVLRVPLFQLGGDVATHLLSIVATLVTAGLMIAWFAGRGDEPAGWVAAALFCSSPLVVQLATTGYVEALLTMFVAASFFALDRWFATGATAWLVAAGVFAGSAASVKYLGLFWVGVVALIVFVRGEARWRSATIVALAAVAAMTPWYGRILWHTGNPIFPFASGIFGSTAWDIVPASPRTLGERILAFVRLPWDLMFARARTGYQPPLSPFLAALAPLVVARAFRNRLTSLLAITVAAWCAVWIWLPPDARYLEPALPLAGVAGALALRELANRFAIGSRRAFAIAALVIVLPGVAYAAYRIARSGAIPVDAASRDAWLERRIPEYRAIAFLNGRSDRSTVAWLCGGEQLAYHFRGELIGDLSGPARFEFARDARDEAELDRRAGALGARYLVVVKGQCAVPALGAVRQGSRFARIYDDERVTVWERSAR